LCQGQKKVKRGRQGNGDEYHEAQPHQILRGGTTWTRFSRSDDERKVKVEKAGKGGNPKGLGKGVADTKGKSGRGRDSGPVVIWGGVLREPQRPKTAKSSNRGVK